MTNGASLRIPTALAERMRDTEQSPFARAAQRLGRRATDIEGLRAALVTLTNRVLAADRVSPGDDEAVPPVLERLAATLDVALDRVAPGRRRSRCAGAAHHPAGAAVSPRRQL